MPKKQNQNQQLESAGRPVQKPAQLLRLTADMFRQHSELYLKHAAVLERVASNPSEPLAWQLEEPSPEQIQDKLLQEHAAELAVKGYQSMLHVQKRVDYMEGLMIKNGIGKRAIVKCRGKKVKKIGPKEDPCSPFYWFAREHAVRVGKSLDQPACSPPVSRELQRFWQRMNPAEQKSYVDKAERAKQTSMVSASKKLTGRFKPGTSSGNPESREDSESDSSSSSKEEEGRLRFQSRSMSSEIESWSAKAGESSESEYDTD